jgi:uncharacterized protein (DUF342 family)
MTEPTLTIRGDVGTDVDHEGDVLITGSVRPGRQVRSAGRLVVRGNVREASLTAGTDIVVEGYVSGGRCLLDAVGDVTVRHVSDARVIAGRDIRIGRVAERSTLLAGRRIRFREPPALLRSGRVWATEGLEAARVEAAGGEPPEIRIGDMPFEETAEELRERIAAARGRTNTACARTEATVAEYRRHCSAATIYRNLTDTLSRRLQQVETAAGTDGAPWFRVTGSGPMLAHVALGPVEDAFPGVHTPEPGGFTATVVDGELRIAPNENEETAP